MTMKWYAAISFFFLLLFYSCKKTVTLGLNNLPARIVIQGEITNSEGPYMVKISQSVGFYDDNNFPAVSGAQVKITDDLGFSDSLTETAPGIYSTHVLKGRPGGTYNLSVIAQQKQYTAVSTMPRSVGLDSVTFETFSGFGRNQISAVVNFQDPPGIRNFYRFVEHINDKPFTKNIFIFSDRLSDGRYIVNTLRSDSAYLDSGDLLEVKMYCIDEPVYNYFYQLEQSSGNGAFNTAASPANPVSNISNGAFGYFSAHTVRSRKVRVY